MSPPPQGSNGPARSKKSGGARKKARPTVAVAPEEVEVLAPGSAPKHPYLPVRVEYDDPDDLEDDRISDVNEWGRSEHMRELARRLYDPVYRNWFRVEWEGLEKIPTDGGALLVANHAAAIPSDAPVIMHGIEKELDRPCYGLADNLFRTLPVIGTCRSLEQVVISAPALTTGAGVTVSITWSTTERQLPLPVVVSVSSTLPVCSSKFEGTYCAFSVCAFGE